MSKDQRRRRKRDIGGGAAFRPPCTAGDLITAFIKQGEAEWGAAEEEDDRKSSDEDSCSEPSQWWGEAPKKKFDDTEAHNARGPSTQEVGVDGPPRFPCSEPSQWWREAPESKTLDKILDDDITGSRAKVDVAKAIPDGGGNAPLEQASLTAYITLRTEFP